MTIKKGARVKLSKKFVKSCKISPECAKDRGTVLWTKHMKRGVPDVVMVDWDGGHNPERILSTNLTALNSTHVPPSSSKRTRRISREALC